MTHKLHIFAYTDSMAEKDKWNMSMKNLEQ